MRICIRFHMSGIFDSGWAPRLLDALKKRGDVVALVTGTTGATAVLDARMEEAVRPIRERWSYWLKQHERDKFEICITATHTADLERVRAECWHLARRVPGIPLIGIDTNCRAVVPWAEGTEGFAKAIAAELGFEINGKVDFGRTFWTEGGKEFRRVLAVTPGDWIVIDWLVVGKALTTDIVVVKEGGRVAEVRGADVKQHGLEKLGDVNLAICKIDTVATLRGEVQNRRTMDYRKAGNVAFINHAGYDVYRFLEAGISAAVTVGDDTTAVAGDVLSRYGIPVVGLTDGDADGLLSDARYAKNSVILRLIKDDVFGKIVFDEIFEKKSFIGSDVKKVKEAILDLAKKRGQLREVIVPAAMG